MLLKKLIGDAMQLLVVHVASLVCLTGPAVGFDFKLKSAPHAEAKDRLFLVKEERKSVDDLIFTSVRIISINQSKRHVQNWHLNAQLRAQTAAQVAELGKQALVEADHRIDRK